MKRIISTVVLALLLPAGLPAAERHLDDFFRDFTAAWVRTNPNLATSSRYFSGEAQETLERGLTPLTPAWRRERIKLARKGLAELRTFDRARLNDTDRVSADVMQWQLDTLVREEPYLEYTFPLEQMNGANVTLVNTLTVVHPILTEKDAAHYVARLGQVSDRMDEAIAEARSQAGKGLFPPRFILNATIKHMRDFVDSPPA